MDRVATRRLIGKLVVCFGIASTTNIPDQVKISGFQQATEASVSLGIDDLLAVPSRGWLVQDAEKEGYISEQHYRLGSLHAVEKLRQSIEAWYATSECSKREMNPSFKMIDPLNPVHMMSFSGARGNISQVHQLLGMRGLMSDPRGQVIDLPIRRNLREGLSLTEYIISRYGARKGVVDTAVRTSDAGYLTRRLVEVAQHIAVRKKDCETTRRLTLLNTTEEKGESIGTISYQRLVGRVLADNVYWDVRCIATRNQDISDGLASNLIASAQPIHVRSPLTCRSIFWIRQLRYGRSLAHYNLVELGEAVGIIAGQSIGEPGTQLTLRTFHTGGVFTGDIAEYVRISFNGLINSDEKLVHPTRTRHGHPAWMCRNDPPILIKSCGDVHNFVIPARSLLMIRNGQYVESQQIIAEVRAREFPLKERIQKYIYPNLEGEIHWSRFVWHVRDCIDSPIRVVSEAGHIWILSGASSDSAKNYSCHEDQDRVGIRPHSIEWRRNYSEEVDEEWVDVSDSNGGDFQEGIREFGIDPKHFLNWSEPPICNYILPNIRVERSEEKKSVSLLLERRQENLSQSYFVSIDVQLNSILDEDDIFAVYENSEYQTRASGAIIYGTIKVEPIDRGTFGDGGTQEQTSSLRYRVVGGGNFFLIPEETYIISEPPSSILAPDNTIVQEGARITGTITSKVGGLIRIGNTPTSTTSVKILPGYIRKPAKTTSKIKRGDHLVAPGDTIIDGIEANSWVYLQSVTLHRERKTSVPVRPVIEYDVSSDSLVQVAFCPDKPKTQRCAKIETLPHIFHKNGEKVENLDHAIIQLVRTCLAVGCRRYFCETLPTEKKYLSLTNVKINNLLDTFIQVNSMISPPTRKIGVTRVFQKSMSLDESSLTQVDLSNSIDKLVPKYTVHSVSEQGASFLILSSLNFSRTTSSADSGDDNYEEKIGKYFHGSESSRSASAHIYRSSKKLPLSSKSESLSKKFPNLNVEERLLKSERSSFTCRDGEVGLLGTSWAISYPSVPPHSSLSGKISTVRKHFVNYPMQALEHHHSYLIDENQLISKCSVNPVLNRYLLYKPIYLPPKLLSRGVLLINLGLSIGGSRCLRKNSVCFQSGQIVAIHQDYSLARTGKTLLATRGAIPKKISGDTTGEGDTSLTLPYDRLKSGDITQGLPKVEQLLESRSIASIPARIEDLLGRWNRSITRLIGSLWSHYLSAGASMERCQLVLIDQIRKVYESQGVQISDKHLEIIIWQLTSRVVASEDGITNVFFPGELVELSQAERMNRVLKRSIFYEPIVLGMTKASLSTTSFLSEASFQETTRVLAKAALRGRIDRLKGLKENVILGDAVPIGTGSPEIVCQLKVNRQKEFHSAANGSSKNSNWGTKNSLRAYCEK